MERVASLDLLRGVAAFSVAIPHYFALNSTGWHPSEVVAVLAVEVFFALSGFVLASQILSCVRSGRAANVQVFLLRRWMRTVPPYLLALLAISYATGQIASLDFARYFLYVQNLFRQHNAIDYFPVAWSLSIEEWFYITFIVIVFVSSRVYGRRDEVFCACVALLFIVSVAVLRTISDPLGGWDADIRRTTAYRVDSIAYGFLLYLAVQHWQRGRVVQIPFAIRFGPALIFSLFGTLAAAVTAFALIDGLHVAKVLFPFVAPMFGASAVLLFYSLRLRNKSSWPSGLFLFMGRVSYSVYLFHMLFILALRPQLQPLSLPLQVAIYVCCMLCACAAFYYYFERPILSARPGYKQESSSGTRVTDVFLPQYVKSGL
jgi:peptidoglycan/LPS O-acetylase OafA/YrhL